MQGKYIYSIGHGKKSFDDFLLNLLAFDIDVLIDVRSRPFTKWAPQFNRDVIVHMLKGTSIKYCYLGDALGGKPFNGDCYDNDGYYDYHKMASMPEFVSGIRRLISAHEQQIKVATMCVEYDPAECHRSKLIGRELYFGANISMSHILTPNKIKTQVEIMTELDSGKGNWPNGDIFNPTPVPPFFKSNKPHKIYK